jgi:hypothetical protein
MTKEDFLKEEVKTEVKKPKTKKEVIKPTEEDMILGKQEKVVEVEVIDYQAVETRYNVKIYANGRTINVNGREVGAFLGQENQARQALKEGAKSVVIKERKGNDLIDKYKIEVV